MLFTDVSSALSVKTADALAKLIDDENAIMAISVDSFNEQAVLRKTLGRHRQQHLPKPLISTIDQPSPAKTGSTVANSTASTASDEIVLVRYGLKLKQLLGVDAFTVS